MPALCIRETLCVCVCVCVHATLRGAHSRISTQCVCVCMCVAEPITFFTAAFGNHERLLGSSEKHREWLALWMSSDVCDPLTQWFRNISSTLSLLGSQILPFPLNSIQSHQISARAGDEGQASLQKLTLFARTGKGAPATKSGLPLLILYS